MATKIHRTPTVSAVHKRARLHPEVSRNGQGVHVNPTANQPRLWTEIVEVPLKQNEDLHEERVYKALEEVGTRGELLRWGLLEVRPKPNGRSKERVAFLEASLLTGFSGQKPSPIEEPFAEPIRGIHIALVVPTGVGALIGGYIGDAGRIAAAFDGIADTVIVHPNVVNGGTLYGGTAKTIYAEGGTLDGFFAGERNFGKPKSRTIGVILDRLTDKSEMSQMKIDVQNTANAMQAANGVHVPIMKVCSEKVRVRSTPSDFAHYTGRIDNPEVLLKSAEALLNQGANALSPITFIGDIDPKEVEEHYRGARTANPYGAIEALISRFLALMTGVPTAHAPWYGTVLGHLNDVAYPGAAPEVISKSGAPCVLNGLAHSPTIVEKGGIGVRDLTAVIAADCIGGPFAFAAMKFGIPLVVVKDNECVVGVKAGKKANELDLPNAIIVKNYAQAFGYVGAKQYGLEWNPEKADVVAKRVAQYSGVNLMTIETRIRPVRVI